VVFQPADTSGELRIPILDDSLGVEGTEDFTADDDDDETFVEITPVNYIVRRKLVFENYPFPCLSQLRSPHFKLHCQ